MSAPKYAVGDTVMIRRVRGGLSNDVQNNPPAEGVVVKVGRALVSVEEKESQGYRWHTATKYRMDTGLENGDFPGSRIDTPEALADEERRRELRETLAGYGVSVTSGRGYGEVKLSTHALAQIADVVAADRRQS